MACTVVYCVTAFVWATVTVLTTSVVVVACACTVSGTPCVVVFVFVGIGRHEQALEMAAEAKDFSCKGIVGAARGTGAAIFLAVGLEGDCTARWCKSTLNVYRGRDCHNDDGSTVDAEE
jgi:hypothetical protein